MNKTLKKRFLFGLKSDNSWYIPSVTVVSSLTETIFLLNRERKKSWTWCACGKFSMISKWKGWAVTCDLTMAVLYVFMSTLCMCVTQCVKIIGFTLGFSPSSFRRLKFKEQKVLIAVKRESTAFRALPCCHCPCALVAVLVIVSKPLYSFPSSCSFESWASEAIEIVLNMCKTYLCQNPNSVISSASQFDQF